MIKKSLIIAIILSMPLYLISFGIDNKLINTILVIFGLFLFYRQNIKSYPWIGFWISILWLWWIGMSFRYYNLTFLIPFVILLIGFFYWIVFYILSLFRIKIVIILFFVFGLHLIKPFGFDWFRYDVLLPHTYFYSTHKIFPLPLKIKLVNTKIPQNKKWQKQYIQKEINDNFSYINQAIRQKYDIVVLPETAFPLSLNKYQNLMNYLKHLSNKITIITGALYYDQQFHNSTYVFNKGKVKIINKHILVPFGEYIPFFCCQKFINKLFFNGGEDFVAQKNFGVYKIKNITFLNAICYEATNEKLYKQKPKYIIAISNNAWFYPSIEETLQNLLIQFYSQKYHKFVYHAKNF